MRTSRYIIVPALCAGIAAGCVSPQATEATIHPGAEREHEVTRDHPLDTVRLSPLDGFDMGTTAYGLWGTDYMVESNPLLAAFGDAAPIAGLGLKYGLKKGLVTFGDSTAARANVAVNTGGMLGGCTNIAGIAGIDPYSALAVGAVCAVAYNRAARADYRRETGRTLSGTSVRKTR